MDWNDFIRPFRQSELFGDAAWKILQSFFNTAGCINDPAEETLKSWLYSKRNCKVNTYFPMVKQTVIGYFAILKIGQRENYSNSSKYSAIKRPLAATVRLTQKLVI